MRLIEKLRQAIRKSDPALRPTPPIKQLSRAVRLIERAKVLADPTRYNRAGRRVNGFRGRAVPKEFFQPEMSTFIPRFVRRHATQKRHRAKVLRIMASYGMTR